MSHVCSGDLLNINGRPLPAGSHGFYSVATLTERMLHCTPQQD